MLASIDPRKSRTIELRFFGGLSVEEPRDWRIAKLWWLHELRGERG